MDQTTSCEAKCLLTALSCILYDGLHSAQGQGRLGPLTRPPEALVLYLLSVHDENGKADSHHNTNAHIWVLCGQELCSTCSPRTCTEWGI